jgi:hypothetical protein
MWRSHVLAVLAFALLPACGAADSGPDVAPPQAPNPNQQYEADTTVLESAAHGPMLCLGGIEESLPPQCGDVPITNWDWSAVDGEENVGGTRWGSYHVVGRFDGDSFAVIEVGPYRAGASALDVADEIETACPTPAGGWRAADPSRMSEADFQAANAAARSQPDFAGLWIDRLGMVDPNATDRGGFVLNAAFTDDLEEHESQLRGLWGGPLCVTRHEHTLSELQKVQNELMREGGKEFGLLVLFSSVSEAHNSVELGVVVIDDEAREALDDQYGEGTVRVLAALQPVP